MIHPTSLFIRTLTKLAGMPTGKGGKHDWHALIKESGLEVISLHTDLGSLKRDLSQVAQEAKSFATKFVVITGMYRFDYTSTEALKSLCADLNACGEALKKEGLTLCYHNHNVEFQRLENGQTAFSYLLQHTNPEFVFFEFDSYWAAEAGVNVYKLLAGLKGRVKLHHINDRGSKAKGPFMTPILESDSMELGTGNMDLEELILLDKESGWKQSSWRPTGTSWIIHRSPPSARAGNIWRRIYEHRGTSEEGLRLSRKRVRGRRGVRYLRIF
jgi:sugar phosphate isomerase/epimerase